LAIITRAGSAQNFINQGGKGFNVTVPFKIDAFNLATKHSINALTQFYFVSQSQDF
jgi:shikimate 5-dehydrogenase